METYHRDVYGRTIRSDKDILDNGKGIDGHTLYKHNIYNKVIESQEYTNDVFAAGVKNDWNTYDQIIRTETYNKDINTLSSVANYNRNAYGQMIKEYHDKNSNNKWDNGDYINEYEVSPLTGSRLVNTNIVNKNGQEIRTQWRYTRDDFDREIIQHNDSNENGKIDGDETNNHLTYQDGLWTKLVRNFGDQYHETLHAMRDEADRLLGTIVETKAVEYITYSGYGRPINSIEDYTSLAIREKFKFLENRLDEIKLSPTKVSTDITLDKAVITALTDSNSKKLVINGDATDTVRIKALDTTFEASTDVKANNQTYKQYTTTVENDQYTLLIDSDINIVNLG